MEGKESSLLLGMKLFLNEFLFAFLCVVTVKAYVVNRYAQAAIYEAAFATILFYGQRIACEDERARSWTLGYPFHLTGSVLGVVFGMFVSNFA